MIFIIFFPQYLEAMLSPSGRHSSQTPTTSTFSTRARKRKRLREAMSKLVQNESPALHKRRSSVSDAGLLSMSGSFLDCTISPEKQPDGMFHVYFFCYQIAVSLCFYLKNTITVLHIIPLTKKKVLEVVRSVLQL
jgi:hypothetical protein